MKIVNSLMSSISREISNREEKKFVKGSLIGALLQLSDEALGVILVVHLKKTNLIIIDGFVAITNKLVPSEGLYF